jgi:hypothetical protein
MGNLNMRQLLNPIFFSREPVRHPDRKRQQRTRARDLTRGRQRQIKGLRVWQLPRLPETNVKEYVLWHMEWRRNTGGFA